VRDEHLISQVLGGEPAPARLEERIGVTLVRRTTRSIQSHRGGRATPCTARPALDELRTAVAAVGEFGDEPRAVPRLHVSRAGESI